MSVYVDDYKGRYRGMVMCHMMADTLDELHAMAEKIGLRRSWFQDKSPADMPHYDVCTAKRCLAVKYGAIEIGARELVAKFSPRLRVKRLDV